MNRVIVLILLMGFQFLVTGQSKKVLFIGNSYTYVNDLPLMFYNLALSTQDTIVYSSSAPGGATFNNHTQNSTSISKIMEGNWDYVVLQEQSQLPSFPESQVVTECFPYAHILDSLINEYNPCAETVFYMTWGRKNGDASNCASWPPVCTYEGMDSLLRIRYTQMAVDNNAILSPVSVVWKHLRANNPTIELYSSDESHPSVAGTYAAACSFYASILRKDPTLATYYGGLDAATAQIIQNTAKSLVYDSLQNWFVGIYDPIADFNYGANNLNVTFTNNSVNAENYSWDFGDGNFSSAPNPTHLYNNAGIYNVKLIASKCNHPDTITKEISITAQSISETRKQAFNISPNPCNNIIYIEMNTEKTNHSYLIINHVGQNVMMGNLNNVGNTIHPVNVSSLSPGIYTILLMDEDRKVCNNQRMIKLK
jgi:PKD repeat protein